MRVPRTVAGLGIGTKAALSLGVVGVAGSLAAFGTYSAFSASTASTGNTFASGTVSISDNDAGAAAYTVSEARPGTNATSCIKVDYTGSLPATVKLYTPEAIGPIGRYVDLTITPGTQATPSFPGCAGFTPAAGGAVFTGTLADWGSTRSTFANGLTTTPAGQAAWNRGDAVVYRVSVTLQDQNAAQGLASGAHSFVWEAQNQ
jgi:hypothetical protein